MIFELPVIFQSGFFLNYCNSLYLPYWSNLFIKNNPTVIKMTVDITSLTTLNTGIC